MLKKVCCAVLLSAAVSSTYVYGAEESAGASATGTRSDAASQEAYKSFVAETGNEIIQVLVHKESSLAERKSQFRQILQTKFSIPSIGKFVLARYWRQADDAQKARYLGLFETAIVENYAAQFDNYSNEKLEVTGAQTLEDGGVLVNSRVVRPSGAEPLSVDWKVFRQSKGDKAGTFKVVDLIVNGVSMSITQRSEYAGLIQSTGGDINAFLDSLDKKYQGAGS